MCTGGRPCFIWFAGLLLLLVFCSIDAVACRSLGTKWFATHSGPSGSNAGLERVGQSSRLQALGVRVKPHPTTATSGRPCSHGSKASGFTTLMRGLPNGLGQDMLQGPPRQLLERRGGRPRVRTSTTAQQQAAPHPTPEQEGPGPTKPTTAPNPLVDRSNLGGMLISAEPATKAVENSYRGSSTLNRASLQVRARCGDGGSSLCTGSKERTPSKGPASKASSFNDDP
jgi:hypothetical protein